MKAPWMESGSPLGMVLGIFAREPVSGQVKTRLTPSLGAAEAAELYRLCLLETVEAMSLAGFDPVIFFSGNEAYFRHSFPRHRRTPQQGGDLGERLARALADGLLAGADGMVVIGSDAPDLPPPLVAAAFAALREAEAVVAPALDGGYVLIGERTHHDALFRGIPWGGPQVLAATRAIAGREGVSLAELEGWDDIDDPASLRRFVRRSPDSAAARYAAGLDLAGAGK
ncbi:MAG: TIGR04282 family arsenosugar biosynthesis glycosyltransferase [Deltaproteobacteria bacterium]|nr:TIGR04282 family arsenosugar biosynthesis glycosyltransferase [Deltaproteobacteria bacterium]